jgi:hypothetical protein
MSSERWTTLGAIVVGVCLGAVLQGYLFSGPTRVWAQNDQPTPNLLAEIEALKGKLPDQAHAMQDVGYHFSNLWFAGQNDNWDLAQFYWNEVRSHLHWAVRIIPVRKDNEGNDVKLEEILAAFENGPLKQLNDTIASKDRSQFEQAYRATIEGCYSCHKASDKPFIRPQVPTEPETPVINFDPAATWPR